jgi:hypothetical protein
MGIIVSFIERSFSSLRWTAETLFGLYSLSSQIIDTSKQPLPGLEPAIDSIFYMRASSKTDPADIP